MRSGKKLYKTFRTSKIPFQVFENWVKVQSSKQMQTGELQIFETHTSLQTHCKEVCVPQPKRLSRNVLNISKIRIDKTN